MLLTPIGNCGPTESVFFADTVGLRAAAVLALVAGATALYYRARARRSLRDDAGLREGPAAVHGRVERADTLANAGATSASPVRIAWTGPFVPRVDLAPLWLVHRSGARVRVDPPRQVEWTEGLDDVSPLISQAFEKADLKPGVAVTLYGLLAQRPDPNAADQNYRRAGVAWELRPDPRGTLLFSLRAPDAPAARLATYHTRWALGIALAIVALQCTAFLRFNVLRLFGQHATLPMVQSANDVADDANVARVLYVGGRDRGSRVFTSRVEHDPGDRAETEVPWLVAPGLPDAFNSPGSEPTAPWWGLALAGAGFALAVLMYGVGSVSRVRWYRSQRDLLRPWTAVVLG